MTYKIGLTHTFSDAIEEAVEPSEPAVFNEVDMVYFNSELASQLEIKLPSDKQAVANILSGQTLPYDAKPVAQAYAGHQFGHFNPQLGDGRSLQIGELTDKSGIKHELDLKGSGATVFSRGGDGKAALGPMLREVIISEAMAAYQIPTTRSLSIVTTGEFVFRDPPQPGAVLARTASSHVRFGTFQYFAARNNHQVLEKLVTFCIDRHYPEVMSRQNPPFQLLNKVVESTANMVANWMSLGFIHGVMNTDNMLVSAETIDYGPCAFMENYDPKSVFSSIDANSRYAYMNQPGAAQWNLSRFAETLLPLIDSDQDKAVELATESVKSFVPKYESAYRNSMQNKLNITPQKETDKTDQLIEEWCNLLELQKVDWTLAHAYLDDLLIGKNEMLYKLFAERRMINEWLVKHSEFINKEAPLQQGHNPKVIPRNHLVEDALSSATVKGDYTQFNHLVVALNSPFDFPEDERLMQPASEIFTKQFVTFCGT